jgi:Protein of unknown function (DUF3143)
MFDAGDRDRAHSWQLRTKSSKLKINHSLPHSPFPIPHSPFPIPHSPFLMTLPSADTPLYNHPLPEIEKWLKSRGCEQNLRELHCWHIDRPTWKAELALEIDQLTIRYINAGNDGQDIQRFFKYSLSRQDIEAAVFSGP